jgi:hypothetical protein
MVWKLSTAICSTARGRPCFSPFGFQTYKKQTKKEGEVKASSVVCLNSRTDHSLLALLATDGVCQKTDTDGYSWVLAGKLWCATCPTGFRLVSYAAALQRAVCLIVQGFTLSTLYNNKKKYTGLATLEKRRGSDATPLLMSC